jgi:hypothetical protein
MGSIFRRRTGLVAVLAVVVGGVFAPSALATTPLTITKTATAHWTKSYKWTIDKSVDKSTIEVKKGQSATATYTVSVTKTADTESMWVDGEVCVQNNGTVATEGLVIEDRLRALLPDGSAQTLVNTFLDISANPVLDPGESYCYPYSLPFTPYAGAIGYENRAFATITNDPREPGTALGPKADAAFVPPAAPTVVGDSINVDDTNGMSWSFSASGSKTYRESFTCGDKGEHRNTATIRETGQSDSVTVVVKCKDKDRDDDDCKKSKKDKDKWGWGRHDDRRGDDCDDDDRGHDRDHDYGHHYDGHGRNDCDRYGFVGNGRR